MKSLYHQKNTFHSPFDRLPEELGSQEFYLKHQDGIREKLELLSDVETFNRYWENLEKEKGQEKNGIFSWDPEVKLAVLDLVRYSRKDSLAQMLEHQARDFHRRSKGLPDLILIENSSVRFAEVKAPGDSLRSHQFAQMKALKKAGYEVELLRVEYRVSAEQSYVIVDLETTGGMLPYHRITEIGAVKIRNNEIVETFQSLVNPQRKISEKIQKLTGITNDMVKEAPTFKEVADSFQEFTKGCIFVAHNVNFDYGFLQNEYGRLEMSFVRPFLCTKQLMKKHFPNLPSYSLASITKHFQVPLMQHHRAMCDAEATAKLFLIINEKRSQ